MNKKLIITSLILFLVVFSILFGAFLEINFFSDKQYQYKENEFQINQQTNIHFKGISGEDKEEILKIVNSLKPMYSKTLGDLYFTNYVEYMYPICNNCNGFNIINNKDKKTDIYVFYKGNILNTKKILCHEILHNIVIRDESRHKFVYDMTQEGVCYTK